jgi:hypothetical protein
MTRLPVVSSDSNTWGAVLNAFLGVAHNTDGSLNAFINPKDAIWGAKGDGSTDDTTALQNALNAAANGLFIWPAGVYIVTASLLYPGNIKIIGAGDSNSGTVIRVKTGTALTTPVLCSADWYNNAATSGNPVEISDIQIDGNSATSGSSAHGLVSMNFWSSFDNLTIKNVTGAGFLHTAQSQNGTHISNTCVEPKIRRLQIRNCSGHGISIIDNGSPLTSCTDGFINDCIIAGVGTRGININTAAGWFVLGNHIYGTGTEAIKADQCFATRIIGNYIDGFGSGSSTNIAAILMNILDGRGSSCIANHIGFEGGSATGPYYGININGNGSGNAVAIVNSNTVVGGGQSGSIGYLIQTVNSSLWKCYFHDNDAKGVSTAVTYSGDTDVQGGDLAFLGHLGSLALNAPTAAAGANAGSSPPAPVKTNCSDVSGKITFGTGTGPAAGAQAVITFNTAYANAPTVVLTPINSASAALNLYVSSTTTTFTVSCVNAPSASQANTVYGFFYHVLI